MEVKFCIVTARVMNIQEYKFIVSMKQHPVHSHLFTSQAQLHTSIVCAWKDSAIPGTVLVMSCQGTSDNTFKT